jgi:tRNA (guanine-N7-)-methyltransferase
MIYHIRTYGRLRCRKFNNDILHNHPALYNNIPINLSNKNNICLEIGFGNGEVLLHRSIKYNDLVHIGVDLYENGICKVLKYITQNNTTNIYIYKMDIRDFFLLNKGDISFKEIYILFPDPWYKKSPKKKEKKRLVNEVLIQCIYSNLILNGNFFFASDHLDYYEYVLNIIKQNNKFQIIKETVNEYLNDDFVPSNYEKKAINNCYYMQIEKIL